MVQNTDRLIIYLALFHLSLEFRSLYLVDVGLVMRIELTDMVQLLNYLKMNLINANVNLFIYAHVQMK